MHKETTTFLTAALRQLALLGLFAGLNAQAQSAFPAPTTQPQTFTFSDGGQALFYTHRTGQAASPQALVFIIDGSGCLSMNYPDRFTEGLGSEALVLALNKRHVTHEGSPQRKCGREFELANHPRQWFSDRMEFISAQLKLFEAKPAKVLLLGISEGASVAARLARARTDITHLAVIGDGGWPLRRVLTELFRGKPNTPDVDAGWREIAADAQSVDKFWLGNPYRWWFDVMDKDPAPDYLALDMPILIGMGELDRSVPVESARSLAASFKEAGKRNLSLIVYPGAGHMLSNKDSSFRPDFFRAVTEMLR